MRTKAAVVEGIKPCCYQKKRYENIAQKPAAMHSCFVLFGPHQHGTASRGVLRCYLINIKVMENDRVVACNDQGCDFNIPFSHFDFVIVPHLFLFLLSQFLFF